MNQDLILNNGKRATFAWVGTKGKVFTIMASPLQSIKVFMVNGQFEFSNGEVLPEAMQPNFKLA